MGVTVVPGGNRWSMAGQGLGQGIQQGVQGYMQNVLQPIMLQQKQQQLQRTGYETALAELEKKGPITEQMRGVLDLISTLGPYDPSGRALASILPFHMKNVTDKSLPATPEQNSANPPSSGLFGGGKTKPPLPAAYQQGANANPPYKMPQQQTRQQIASKGAQQPQPIQQEQQAQEVQQTPYELSNNEMIAGMRPQQPFMPTAEQQYSTPDVLTALDNFGFDTKLFSPEQIYEAQRNSPTLEAGKVNAGNMENFNTNQRALMNDRVNVMSAGTNLMNAEMANDKEFANEFDKSNPKWWGRLSSEEKMIKWGLSKQYKGHRPAERAKYTQAKFEKFMNAANQYKDVISKPWIQNAQDRKNLQTATKNFLDWGKEVDPIFNSPYISLFDIAKNLSAEGGRGDAEFERVANPLDSSYEKLLGVAPKMMSFQGEPSRGIVDVRFAGSQVPDPLSIENLKEFVKNNANKLDTNTLDYYKGYLKEKEKNVSKAASLIQKVIKPGTLQQPGTSLLNVRDYFLKNKNYGWQDFKDAFDIAQEKGLKLDERQMGDVLKLNKAPVDSLWGLINYELFGTY